MFRHLTRSLFFFGMMGTAFGQTIEFKLGTLAPERVKMDQAVEDLAVTGPVPHCHLEGVDGEV